jgi:hypothetical protein
MAHGVGAALAVRQPLELDCLDPQLLRKRRLVFRTFPIIVSAASRTRKNSTTFSIRALTAVKEHGACIGHTVPDLC